MGKIAQRLDRGNIEFRVSVSTVISHFCAKGAGHLHTDRLHGLGPLHKDDERMTHSSESMRLQTGIPHDVLAELAQRPVSDGDFGGRSSRCVTAK
jgi:hypothetical protein